MKTVKNVKNVEKQASDINIKKILFSVIVVCLLIIILGFAINFTYAIGYILILIIHELGHYFAAKLLKVKVLYGGFTPIGAYIVHEKIDNCRKNALVAIGGPALGSMLGLVYYIIYYFNGNNTFLVLSMTAIAINLLNLIPVNPLDGGYIVEGISPVFCYLGFPILFYFFVVTKRFKSRIILLIVMAVGAYKTYDFTMIYRTDLYYKISKNSRIKLAMMYSVLLVVLALCFILINNSYDFKTIIKTIMRFK